MKLQRPDPGIDAAKSGLHGKAGIFFNAGLLSKGGGFNPLDLDPYLLFDARTSMIGTLENPTLDLDPSKQDTLDVITATRAGVATYTDFNGNIASASPNTVRVDHVDGVPMILVEPSATNIIYNSSAFSTSGTAVKTTGFEAPDGSNTAAKISNMQDATGTRSYSQVTGVSGSTAYVGSIYLKGTAGETIRIEARRQAGATFSSSGTRILTFDGTWQRVTNLAWTTAADNTAAFILIKNEFGTTADEVYLWGAQLETGSVSTSVIPTSGSTVTRAADDLVISGSAFSDFYNQSEGTFYVESVPNENTSGSFLFDLTKISGESERLLIYNGGSNQKVYISTASTNWVDNIIGTRPAGGVLSRVAISYETNNVQASLDGVNMVPDTSATMSTSIGKMTIGNRYETSRYLNGRIRRLIFWPYSSDRL